MGNKLLKLHSSFQPNYCKLEISKTLPSVFIKYFQQTFGYKREYIFLRADDIPRLKWPPSVVARPQQLLTEQLQLIEITMAYLFIFYHLPLSSSVHLQHQCLQSKAKLITTAWQIYPSFSRPSSAQHKYTINVVSF